MAAACGRRRSRPALGPSASGPTNRCASRRARPISVTTSTTACCFPRFPPGPGSPTRRAATSARKSSCVSATVVMSTVTCAVSFSTATHSRLRARSSSPTAARSARSEASRGRSVSSARSRWPTFDGSMRTPARRSASGWTIRPCRRGCRRCPSRGKPENAVPNRLARETSPYLLQHAENPVDWYAWGDEAFAKARAEDKPILLSVGYSACHWCHVMERESFENREIAGVMNEHFVNVKVDREERPDVDQIYMQAVQSMTGHGGWPMTVFLTSEGVPFYGGTYFPPEDRHGMPGFPRLIQGVAEAYRARRGEVVEAGKQLLEQMKQGERLRSSASLLTDGVLFSAYQALAGEFDPREGGMGRAPKFPQPMSWEFLLRYWKRAGSVQAQDMADLTLTKMARGGMYDQLGGGFHRYSVDGQWLVPHFEKMLYDNAQLASLYLHGWLATGDAEYRRVAEETLDYILREMTHPAGGFFSAQDADSEGVEGKFFVWSADEIRAALPDGEMARAALTYWGA